jgi:hypothetical protein
VGTWTESTVRTRAPPSCRAGMMLEVPDFHPGVP